MSSSEYKTSVLSLSLINTTHHYLLDSTQIKVRNIESVLTIFNCQSHYNITKLAYWSNELPRGHETDSRGDKPVFRGREALDTSMFLLKTV